MSHVFISYSHQDTDYAHKLAREMEDKGFTAWIDERIDYGDEWLLKLETQIDSCAAFLIILTQSARQSPWVPNELTRAVRLRKRIFALWIEGDIWLPLETTHVVDLRKQPRGSMPGIKFYEDLMDAAPRKPIPQITLDDLARKFDELTEMYRQIRTAREMADEVVLPPVSSVDMGYAEIKRWEAFRTPGNNDYYGMTMLALALEAAGTRPQHQEAMINLWRAYKLEPRIIDKHWMTENHQWGDKEHALLENIISDAKFWK